MSIPPTGPVSVGNVVTIWNLPPTTLAPGNPKPIGTQLRLSPPTIYSPTSQTFPASTTSNFPLSKFLGLSKRVAVYLQSVNTLPWTATFTGTAQVLLVAGGGGGGAGRRVLPASWHVGGGGGGGGINVAPAPFVNGTSYPYVTGIYGNASLAPTWLAGNGGNTVFIGRTAFGGGRGGSGGYTPAPNVLGSPGGCGGGSGVSPSGSGGTGSQGGNGAQGNIPWWAAGGGGGGGASATIAPSVPLGPGSYGGNGYTWPADGQIYAGGGGGGRSGPGSFPNSSTPGGTGGGGGSGRGGTTIPAPFCAGLWASGYGAGGGGATASGPSPNTWIPGGYGSTGVIGIVFP